MVRGFGRFDRRVRPAEDTDVFPTIKDDDNTGHIPVPAAAADAEVTGEIPPVRAVGAADEDADVADLEPRDADAEPAEDRQDRLAELRVHALRIARIGWQRLVCLSAVLLAWLVRETRIRVPQAGRWLRPRWTRLSAAILAGLLLCSSYPRFNWGGA